MKLSGSLRCSHVIVIYAKQVCTAGYRLSFPALVCLICLLELVRLLCWQWPLAIFMTTLLDVCLVVAKLCSHVTDRSEKKLCCKVSSFVAVLMSITETMLLITAVVVIVVVIASSFVWCLLVNGMQVLYTTSVCNGKWSITAWTVRPSCALLVVFRWNQTGSSVLFAVWLPTSAERSLTAS